MYKNNVRVFSSPPVFWQGFSLHEALFLHVVGEPIAGSISHPSIPCPHGLKSRDEVTLKHNSSHFEANNRERRFK